MPKISNIVLVHAGFVDGESMTANKGRLLHRQPSGEWLIKRAMWNYQ